MSLEIITIISPYVIGIFAVIGAIITYMAKNIHNRLKKLEERIIDKPDYEKVREMINDKVMPIEQDVAKIDTKLDRIIEILLDDKK